MVEITIQQFGSSVGFVLPQEICTRMGLEVGDRVLLVETESGLCLRCSGSELKKQMTAARRVMTEFRGALRRLAT
jgi:putative addiction module antidote